MEAFLLIEAVILAGVDHVKSGCPEGYRQSQQYWQEIDFSSYGDPGTHGGEAQGDSQYKV